MKKHIIIGITGSVAAYKAAELVSLLVKKGLTVSTIITKAGQHFIGAATFQGLTQRPVYTNQWFDDSGQMTHIALVQQADLIVIVPATANIIAKLAHGIADELLSTVCLATNTPIIIAPAMNQVMWNNPLVQHNIDLLKANNYHVLATRQGWQACRDYGLGCLLDPSQIYDQIMKLLADE